MTISFARADDADNDAIQVGQRNITAVDTFTVTSANWDSNLVSDSSKSWSTNAMAYDLVTMTSGTLNGVSQRLSANTDTALGFSAGLVPCLTGTRQYSYSWIIPGNTYEFATVMKTVTGASVFKIYDAFQEVYSSTLASSMNNFGGISGVYIEGNYYCTYYVFDPIEETSTQYFKRFNMNTGAANVTAPFSGWVADVIGHNQYGVYISGAITGPSRSIYPATITDNSITWGTTIGYPSGKETYYTANMTPVYINGTTGCYLQSMYSTESGTTFYVDVYSGGSWTSVTYPVINSSYVTGGATQLLNAYDLGGDVIYVNFYLTSESGGSTGLLTLDKSTLTFASNPYYETAITDTSYLRGVCARDSDILICTLDSEDGNNADVLDLFSVMDGASKSTTLVAAASTSIDQVYFMLDGLYGKISYKDAGPGGYYYADQIARLYGYSMPWVTTDDTGKIEHDGVEWPTSPDWYLTTDRGVV